MKGQPITTSDRIVTGLGSIAGSLAYLNHQAWWPEFRESRRPLAQVIDDVLWVGHFCGWLQRHRIAIERCTNTDLEAYLATTESFRSGPRQACQRTITALIDFLAAARASDRGRFTIEGH